MLKGQDIIIMLLLRLREDESWTFDALSAQIGLSASQCHSAFKRLETARLVGVNSEKVWHVPVVNCLEIILHGIKYFFPAELGASARGIPTAHSASFVSKNFSGTSSSGNDFVWRDPEGLQRGNSLSPIHNCQLKFGPKKDSPQDLLSQSMYEVLVCIDLLRVGRVREANWALEYLKKKINGSH